MAEPAGTHPASPVAAPSSIVTELRAAIAFLTRFRTGAPALDAVATGAAAFAAVGGLLGLLAAAPVVALAAILPLPAAILGLAVLVVATGALHVDGLADTADAIAAPTADAAERARADPTTGPAGVAAIVLMLGFDASLIAAIGARDAGLAAAALVIAGAASRAAPVVAAWLDRERPAPRRGGLGGWFASQVRRRDVAAAVATTIALAAAATLVVGDARVALGAAAGVLAGALASAAIVARRGQLDGDGHGAIVEATFAAVLAGVALAAVR